MTHREHRVRWGIDFLRWVMGGSVVAVAAGIVGALLTRRPTAFAVAAGVFTLFLLPGLALSYAFLPPTSPNWPLRLALAIALSVATQPLLLFVVSRAGVPLTLGTGLAVSAVLTVAGSLFAVLRRGGE